MGGQRGRRAKPSPKIWGRFLPSSRPAGWILHRANPSPKIWGRVSSLFAACWVGRGRRAKPSPKIWIRFFCCPFRPLRGLLGGFAVVTRKGSQIFDYLFPRPWPLPLPLPLPLSRQPPRPFPHPGNRPGRSFGPLRRSFKCCAWGRNRGATAQRGKGCHAATSLRPTPRRPGRPCRSSDLPTPANPPSRATTTPAGRAGRAGQMLKGMEKQRPGEYQRLHDETVAPSLSAPGSNRPGGRGRAGRRWDHRPRPLSCADRSAVPPSRPICYHL